MMNEELYEKLEQELEKNHVEEDVEDVLLDLAENIAERGIMDKEVIFKQSYGRKRGMLASGGEIDTERASIMVLDEFRSAKLGKITLEQVNG